MGGACELVSNVFRSRPLEFGSVSNKVFYRSTVMAQVDGPTKHPLDLTLRRCITYPIQKWALCNFLRTTLPRPIQLQHARKPQWNFVRMSWSYDVKAHR